MIQPTRPLRRVALLITTLFLLPTASRAADPPSSSPDLTGRWSGRWESGSNGHRGPLRATFRKQDESHYRVVFRGRFFGVVPFRYAVTLDVTGHADDRVFLSGSSRLGPIFGSFHYSAEATDGHFVATFRSRNDHGTFNLSRPPCPCQPNQ